jgi:hypothetical protein
MANDKMEITVNVEKVCHDALFEFAENFYKKTGVRLHDVGFSWAQYDRFGAPAVFALKTVTVTSAGSGNHE